MASTRREWGSRDWSDRAADVLLVLGVMSLIVLNPGGILFIWFATRIRQRREGFRQVAVAFTVLYVVVGAILMVVAISEMLLDYASATESAEEPSWPNAVIVGLLIVGSWIMGFWLTAPGTLKAHEQQSRSGMPASTYGRPTYWVTLLRLTHVPLVCFSLLLMMSIHRPGTTNRGFTPGGLTGWTWLGDRIRYERWEPPIVVEGRYSFPRSIRRGEILVVQSQGGTATIGGGRMQVFQGISYELRFIPALIWAAVSSGLAILVEFLWRWKAERAAGLCRVCGYDLRATPERCPECGTEVARASGAPSP